MPCRHFAAVSIACFVFMALCAGLSSLALDHWNIPLVLPATMAMVLALVAYGVYVKAWRYW